MKMIRNVQDLLDKSMNGVDMSKELSAEQSRVKLADFLRGVADFIESNPGHKEVHFGSIMLMFGVHRKGEPDAFSFGHTMYGLSVVDAVAALGVTQHQLYQIMMAQATGLDSGDD